MTAEVVIRITAPDVPIDNLQAFLDDMGAIGAKVTTAIYRNSPTPRVPTAVCPVCRGHGWVLEANGDSG